MGANVWLRVVHDPAVSSSGCEGVAYWLRAREWQRGDALRADDIQWPDGTPAQVGEVMRCGSCGARLGEREFAALATATLGLDRAPAAA